MCHFVTAVIGATSGIERLNAIAARHHRWLELVENESVRPYLRGNELYYATTPGRTASGDRDYVDPLGGAQLGNGLIAARMDRKAAYAKYGHA